MVDPAAGTRISSYRLNIAPSECHLRVLDGQVELSPGRDDTLSPMRSGTSSSEYGDAIGVRIQEEQRALASEWLQRLVAIVAVEPNAVFATDELLDHVPGLIEAIGRFVAAPGAEDIGANAVVIDKARDLGQIRHAQQASVHQVLREYDLLADVLDQFVAHETARLALTPDATECLDVSRRVSRAVRVLMRTSVATFIAEYTDTITRQTDRLGRFSRAMSHELRNPLGTLQFAATLLDHPGALEDPATRERLAGVIKRTTDRAVALIRSLERLMRAETAAAVDTPIDQVVDLRELVQEVARQLHEMAEERGVDIRVRGEFQTLYVDASSVELVLMNLVSNAIKYSDRSKPERFVEVEGAIVGDHCELRVRDNGIGIPRGSVDSVFDRFFRAHPERDAELGAEGTGLGLAIVEECIKALAGTVVVQSEEGAGTTFVVSLPIKPSPQKSARP